MLERHERDSAVWKKLETYIATRIDELRKQNDNLNLSDEQTKTLRGRIAELKELLRLAEDPIKWEN